ncbi:MaoC/PaaZ C-terminal domain-containing protein [Methylovirgula sp. 4M-Z18]|uniref:MaoC/PaaZ C-terminal domain-containing protein n=1 Tax=Methylovirgula sp. 4M-Z18 TaxID=2293567 RepID=UPI000E2EE192|nr:MaoC/PaaZ C-terminal domain-containing protein [Methylovirgula sp. 4M-Z18]RFB81614.1 dehydratase [Methylovirgula sp. 4M-Z18]
MPKLFFEDFEPGDVATYGAYPVTKEAIIAFAKEFDPQPFHLDEELAKHSLLKGLAASGWHTAAMLMRMNCDHFVADMASLGSPGVIELNWLKPVRPGDILSGRSTIRERRVSQSRPETGLVRFFFEVLNQSGEIVMNQDCFIMVGRRGMEPPPPRIVKPIKFEPFTEVQWPMTPLWFEDMPDKGGTTLGTYTFDTENMIRFATSFDPQPFHLSEEAAKKSPFGQLAASGWHTAAAWMRTHLANHRKIVAERKAAGIDVAPTAPSPGFKDLKWLKPVFAGDVVTYSSRITGKRVTSHPGWGLVAQQSAGVNQHGEQVFEFQGVVFWPTKP